MTADAALKATSFTRNDRELFDCKQPTLRAEVFQRVLLPKLAAVLNKALEKVRQVYRIEPMEDSIRSMYPAHRSKRTRELTALYPDCFAGVGGMRKKGVWRGVKRTDGKPVQILPFRMGFSLDQSGLGFELHLWWLAGLTPRSYRKFFDFYIRRSATVTVLASECDLRLPVGWGANDKLIRPWRTALDDMWASGDYACDFYSHRAPFPVDEAACDRMIDNFVKFFPVYDSLIQISKGEEDRFPLLIARLNAWLSQLAEEESFDELPQGERGREKGTAEGIGRAALKAVDGFRIMPSRRFQILSRDGHKCRACGRAAPDFKLHVDHIVPRSKGGTDDLENLQTLCAECNLGKSNRSSQNLRTKRLQKGRTRTS